MSFAVPIVANGKKEIRISAACCGLAGCFLAGALVLYTKCGAGAGAAILVWALSVLAVYVPGSALRGWICPDAVQSLHPILNLIFGGAAFSVSVVLAGVLHWHFVPVLWSVLGWGLWLVQRRMGDHRSFCNRKDGCLLVLIWSVYVLLNALWAVRYVHPAVATVARPSQDFFWNLGNTESLLAGFPLADLRVNGVTVSYHFLTELLQAGMCMLSHMPAYDVVAFYGYAPIAAAMVIALYGLGKTLWGDAARGRSLLLAAMPLWFGCASLWKVMANGTGRFGNVTALYAISNINGQATAFAALAAFFAVFAVLEQNHWGSKPGLWMAAAAGFYLLVFAKSPQAAVLALALLCAFAVRGIAGIAQKKKLPKRLAGFFLLVPVGFWVVYRLCFSAGANSSVSFSLTGTLNLYFFASILQALQIRFAAVWQVFLPVLWLAQSFLAAPAAFCVWAVSAVRDLVRLPKVDAQRLTWHACIAGGLLAFYLFDHYSSSQLYFMVLALFCLALVFLDRLPAMWQWLSSRKGAAARGLAAVAKAAVGIMAAISCATSLCFGLWLVRTAPTQLAGGVPDERYYALTAQEENACAWLAQNMEQDAIFATNRMHTGTALEGLSNVYTGLSGRQAYCESFKYAVSNMGDNAGDVMTRYEQVSQMFDANTTESELRALCGRTGVTYLVYHAGSPGSDAQLACFEQVYTSDVISIYKVA